MSKMFSFDQLLEEGHVRQMVCEGKLYCATDNTIIVWRNTFVKDFRVANKVLVNRSTYFDEFRNAPVFIVYKPLTE